SGFRCLCAAGFIGNGTSCQVARDACALNNGGCSVNAVCKRTLPGRRDCVCHSGFSGDGLVCVEINACLEGSQGCHENADCLHVGPNKTSCTCHDGYAGDGHHCQMINLCLKKNGGCGDNARCNMSAPGVRTCTCSANYVGDGFSCRGTVAKELLKKKLRDFYLGLMMMEIPLKGRGPFTVFAPSSDAFEQIKKGKVFQKLPLSGEHFATILRSHIVMCHTLLPVDLSRPRNLTSLSGLVLTTSSSQGHIFINQANVTYSDEVSVNGILHVVDQVLVPPDINRTSGACQLNLSDVAERHGYKTFYKLLEDSGVLDLLKEEVHQPLTLLLPSDQALDSLLPEQKNFLFHRENRPQLLEYLKFHVLPAQKVYAEDLVHLASPRTLQGSPLSFRCGGTDAVGEIFVNDGACRIVQRHLGFPGGMAFGIDCLLTPPSLGGRCDVQTTFDFSMACAMCSSSATRCPQGSRGAEVRPPVRLHRPQLRCRSICAVSVWQSRCCHGYYGRDCLACPGGAGSPCSNHGNCDDGHLGNGTCACDPGFGGVACELCSDGFYGAACEACDCAEHGSCDSGRGGTGACFCDAGWGGRRCESQGDQLPGCSPACSPNAVCQDNNTCVCRPFYQGDGLTCTGVQSVQVMNGGCAAHGQVLPGGCSCAKGYGGDGYVCTPLDPCASGDNGGCHQHATCTMTAPGKRKCSCKQNFIGDGLVCEPRQLPVSRCLQDNGGCHLDAQCSDLHSEDAQLGVFHLRSDRGQYQLNYTAAQQLCAAQGASLATYSQLSYAQQGGMNMCAAGWLDQARVAYPTTYSNPLCGFGHVGIVDYGPRRNLSETWDAFCYRMKANPELLPGVGGGPALREAPE
uniref:Stabilin 2 n=1 Tax=Tetraodon nigroviridis TaxID=99883 RepID=H3C877_TETNG